MADGSVRGQRAFHFPRRALVSALRAGEIVVDLFAGGGGASEALRQALGRDPDICVNHDAWAIGMHAANHPFARHLCEDVWQANPRHECAGRPVGWLHASPDCTHFSQAKGGQPRSRATRSLSWVVLKWAGAVRPRIISLENVEQILKWGPLVAKRDRATGRVMKLDGTVASRGERVPIEQQFLVPDKRREGRTWSHFVAALRGLGYSVEWRKLRACDYGAGTSRTRLFMVARCDGEAIRWPDPTHGPERTPFVTAADCIDWSIPCPSIFERKKPLADATMRRIARGIRKFVLDAAEPFIVPNNTNNVPKGTGEPLPAVTTCQGRNLLVAPLLAPATHQGSDRINAASEPVPTITAAHRGELMLAAATLVQTGYGERAGQAPRVPGLDKPLGTLVDGVKHAAVTAILAGVGGRAGDTEPRPVDQPGYTITAKADCAVVAAHLVKFRGDSSGSAASDPVPTITSGAGAARPAGCAHALGVVTAFLEQAAGGPNSNTSPPRAADEPVSTITASGSQQRLVAANLVTLRKNCDGRSATDPVGALCAGAEHHAVVEYALSPEVEAGALRVAAFLVNYYGNGAALDCRGPLDTITTRDRLALVTVHVRGVPHVIVDIGLRMLRPPELYRAQGFPGDYIIDRTADGRAINGTRAVRMVGNSVSPPPLAAIARANLGIPHESAEAA